MAEFRPGEEASGMRVDAWLATCFPDVPRTALRAWLAAGNLTCSGKPCAKGDRMVPGATYVCSAPPQAPRLAPNPSLPCTVLFEDETLLTLCKPAGMDCCPNAPEERDTLANALLARYPELAEVGDRALPCGMLHRIDRDTSGLVLVAKTQRAYDALRAQFTAHTALKHYVALVGAEVSTPGHLENELAHNPRCPGRMVDASRWHDARRPMRAVTDYSPARTLRLSGEVCTLLNVEIRTGVTHQIRAQLAFAGMPIIGDKRYGGRLVEGFPRHFLHASALTFTHPHSGHSVTLEAPLTEDLRALLLHAQSERKKPC